MGVPHRSGRRSGGDRPHLDGAVAADEGALRQALPGSRIIHLATHGFFADAQFRSFLQHDEKNERVFSAGQELLSSTKRGSGVTGRNPLLLSGVALAGANLPPVTDSLELPTGDDGILTAEEVAHLDLRGTELVVLSACDTGRGTQVGGGESVFGLQRAFHLAGARNVVASLWKVDNQATSALMQLFYHKLWREEKPPLAAVRGAQLAAYRHPERITAWGGCDAEALARAPKFGTTAKLPDNTAPPQPPRQPASGAAFLLSSPGQ